MGFCLLVAYGLWLLCQRYWPIIIAGGLVLVACHSTKTVLRNYDWTDDHTLFTAALRVNPNNGKLYNNLGHAYEKERNFTVAEKLFRQASVVQADDVGAFINLGRILKQLNRLEEAEAVR